MLFQTLVAVSLATSLASGAALHKRSQGSQAVYWGQDDNEQSLGSYCTSNQGINIIILSFLSTYGNGVTPSGYVGGCEIDSSGNGNGCESIASDIQTCQSAGVKVFISLGGGGASGSLNGEDDANGVAWSLWNMFANPSAVDSSAPRPFGDSFVNGWDIDVESNPNGDNQYYKYMINTLRSSFSSDPENTYYISGAPQCPLPEENMGDMIANSQFDYLWIQFYNNPYCSAYQVAAGGDFNFDDWYSTIQGGSSAGASLYVGLPASQDASTGGDDGAYFWLDPTDLAGLVNTYSSHAGFGGVMLWDAANSDTVNENGCSYAQEVASVLASGNTC